jgi:hypothetical protein
MFKKLEVPFLKEFKDAELEAFTDESGGSGLADHRMKIRTALQQRLNTHWNKSVLAPEMQSVADLQRVPQFKKLYTSISHAKDLGGFVISKRPVGFDLELRSRILPQIVARVSMPQEVELAPSIAHLWVAKEATYKALMHYHQPTVLSDVLIGGWKQGTYQLLNDKLFKAPLGMGAVWIKEPYIFSVFSFI